MKEILKYKVTELRVDNDDKMKFIVLLDITNEVIIIEGHYKMKLDGLSNFKKIAEKQFNLKSTAEETFDTIIKELYDAVKERVEFATVVAEFFKDRDHVEIVD
jgi:hypothetical protein